MEVKSEYSLGICIPVWNRGEIFAIAFDSLLRQLENINATIWIFDNGSDRETKNIIHNIASNEKHRIVKTYLPQNMGIPYVANVFAKAIQENCDFTNYHSPEYILIMDSDAYFKKPIADMIAVMETRYEVGLISGHDSIEHPSINEVTIAINGKLIVLKEKNNERMLSMLMRKEEFLYNYPFPHFRNRDVDWEITQWNPNSMLRRNRKIMVAADYVLHLGINKSTWNTSDQELASEAELTEVRAILQDTK